MSLQDVEGAQKAPAGSSDAAGVTAGLGPGEAQVSGSGQSMQAVNHTGNPAEMCSASPLEELHSEPAVAGHAAAEENSAGGCSDRKRTHGGETDSVDAPHPKAGRLEPPAARSPFEVADKENGVGIVENLAPAAGVLGTPAGLPEVQVTAREQAADGAADAGSEQHAILQRLLNRVHCLESKVGEHERKHPPSLSAQKYSTPEMQGMIQKEISERQGALLARLAALDSRLEGELQPCRTPQGSKAQSANDGQTNLMYALAALESKLHKAQMGDTIEQQPKQVEATNIISMLSAAFNRSRAAAGHANAQPAERVVYKLARLEHLYWSPKKAREGSNGFEDPLLQLAEMADMAHQVGTPCTPRTHSRLTSSGGGGGVQHFYPPGSRQRRNGDVQSPRSAVASLARLHARQEQACQSSEAHPSGTATRRRGKVAAAAAPLKPVALLDRLGALDSPPQPGSAPLGHYSGAQQMLPPIVSAAVGPVLPPLPLSADIGAANALPASAGLHPGLAHVPALDVLTLPHAPAIAPMTSSGPAVAPLAGPPLPGSHMPAQSQPPILPVSEPRAPAPSAGTQGQVAAQLDAVQSQLSTLQASGSAMAVGALQGILAQLKSLSNQIHGEHTPPGGRDGPHAHQSPS